MKTETLKEPDRGCRVQMIRDYVDQRPWASADEISRWFARQGIQISSPHVLAILLAIRTG